MKCTHCSRENKTPQYKQCEYCRNLASAYSRNNREQSRIIHQKYRHSHPAQMLLIYAKNRAKLQKLPFDLDLKYMEEIWTDICPIFNIPLKKYETQGHHADSYSLDKIIPSHGYVKGNVRIISARANMLRSNATAQELALILNDQNFIEQNS